MEKDFADVLSALNLVSGGALVGITLAEAVVILPLLRSFPPAEGAAALRFAGARAWRFAPVLGAVAWFSGIALVAVWPWHDISAGGVLASGGVVLWTAAVLVTFFYYFPIDKGIRILTADAAAVQAPLRFRRAARAHTLRTTLYAAGFVCFVIGVTLT
jgi:hypothetical protein